MNVTLPNVLGQFPVGTLVGCYAEAISDAGDVRPLGPAVTTANVAVDGSLLFLGLGEGREYFAAAKVGGAWRLLMFSTKAADPHVGPAGPVGPAGEDGSVIHSGNGVPDAGELEVPAVNGDYYLDVLTGNFYGPRTNEGWGAPLALKGDKGDKGEAGASGIPNTLITPSLLIPPRAQKTVFQQFQPGHGYEVSAGTGVMSDDAVDFVVGTQCLKVVTKGDESQTHVRHKTVGPYDFTEKDLRITFKVDGLAHVSTFEVFLSSDNLATNNVHYPVSTPVQPVGADGEWVSVVISWGDLVNNTPPGAIERNKVNFIEFRMEDDKAQPVTFRINEVAAVPVAATSRVSIVFDDGWASTYTAARAYMDKYGFRGSACVIRDLVGSANYMTLAQVKALQAAGWDIFAHANTAAAHNAGFATLTDVEAEAEMVGIKQWLIENGLRRRDLFAWPKGSFTASQQAIARKYFNAIRGITGGKGGGGGAHEVFPPASNGHLRTWLVGSTATAAEVEAALNQCSTYKTWLIFSFHRIVAGAPAESTEVKESVFKEMIDKINAKGLAVKTVAEVLEN